MGVAPTPRVPRALSLVRPPGADARGERETRARGEPTNQEDTNDSPQSFIQPVGAMKCATCGNAYRKGTTVYALARGRLRPQRVCARCAAKALNVLPA